MSDLTREEPKESPVDWADLMARVRVLEADVKHERELRLQAELTTREALSLQAKEMQRRLEELNHAHADKARDFEKYLPRGEFAGILKSWEEWRVAFLEKLESEKEAVRRLYDAVQTQIIGIQQQVTANSERREGGMAAMGKLAAVIIGAVSVIATIMTLVITLTRK